MFYCYLFEIKSIQSYLFSSGKLKDVIAASERIDTLVGDNKKCLLYKLLEKKKLPYEFDYKKADLNDDKIKFIRCKGGAFYAICKKKEYLFELRNIWTLLVQVNFPSLQFIDVIDVGSTIIEAHQKAQKQFLYKKNIPQIKFPYATAITRRYPRTGVVSYGGQNRNSQIFDDDIDIDLENYKHRQAYDFLMKANNGVENISLLQKKFSNNNKVKFPLDLDKHIKFFIGESLNLEKETEKDIALIHIDGNGVGSFFNKIKDTFFKLESKNEKIDKIYYELFNQCSNCLYESTKIAAQLATKFCSEKEEYKFAYEYQDNPEIKSSYMALRPLILGGDDITFYCKANVAIQYSIEFCDNFKRQTQEKLKLIKSDFDKKLTELQLNLDLKIPEELTASGGILYHKVHHPFNHCINLVEELCLEAKSVTKSHPDKKPALAFYCLSSVSPNSLSTIKQAQHEILIGDKKYILSQSAYTLEQIELLQELVKFVKQGKPCSLNRWRKITQSIVDKNIMEAINIYIRGCTMCSNNESDIFQSKMTKLLREIKVVNNEIENECQSSLFIDDDGNKKSVICDLLLLATL